jgi:putative transposase
VPRRTRSLLDGGVYHVFNRAARKLALFESPSEYDAFLGIVAEAQEEIAMRLVCFCVMPNHWHLVLWPEVGRDMSRFTAWLTATHALRWRWRHGTVGQGVVYQGRFKAIPVQCDRHFLTLCRYVERNPVRAGLASRAEDWPWSSASLAATAARARPTLSPWPVQQPDEWRDWVNQPEPEHTLEALRSSITRSVPWGTRDWQAEVTRSQGTEWPRRRAGRPRRDGTAPRPTLERELELPFVNWS